MVEVKDGKRVGGIVNRKMGGEDRESWGRWGDMDG